MIFPGFPSYEDLASFLKEKAEMTLFRRNPFFKESGNIFNEIHPNPLVQILIDFRGNIVNEYQEKYEALLKEKEKEDSNCITG